MRLCNLAVFRPDGLHIVAPRLRRQEARNHADGAAGIGDIDSLATIVARIDLDRRMDAAGRRAADQKRNVEAFALEFRGDMHHLVERRRDQAGKTDDIDLLLLGHFEDLGGRHHDAEVDDLVIVAGEHDADDVLADVVHVALDRRHQDLAGAFARFAAIGKLLRLHVRQQHGNRLLHDACGFHHLRQEHLAGTEEVADDVHAGHQRTLNNVQRPRGG
ncbi:hypothetical protein D9M72_360220 [compost metagenome]